VTRRAHPDLRAALNRAVDAYRAHVRDCATCNARPRADCPQRAELAHAVWHADAACDADRNRNPRP
jgi:hypothetical protein